MKTWLIIWYIVALPFVAYFFWTTSESPAPAVLLTIGAGAVGIVPFSGILIYLFLPLRFRKFLESAAEHSK